MEHSASLGPYILRFCLENIITPPCHELHASATLTGFPRPTPALLFSLPCLCLCRALCLPGMPPPPLHLSTSFSPFFNISSKKVFLILLHPSKTALGSSPSCIHNALCLLLSLNLAFYGSPHSAVRSSRANDHGFKKTKQTHLYSDWNTLGIEQNFSEIINKSMSPSGKGE